MKLDANIKVMMLKGEKGDIGNPTDEQVQAQVTKWIQEHPDSTIDEAIITKVVKEWLTNHPDATIDETIIKNEVDKWLKENPNATIDETIIRDETNKWLDEYPSALVKVVDDVSYELPVHTINDNVTAENSTWSSAKLASMIRYAEYEHAQSAINVNAGETYRGGSILRFEIGENEELDDFKLLLLSPRVTVENSNIVNISNYVQMVRKSNTTYVAMIALTITNPTTSSVTITSLVCNALLISNSFGG